MDVKSDTYSSVGAVSEGLYKESGSRFIALLHPVEDETEVKAILDEARRKYHDARHVCYAYRLGKDGERYRANDDGEPSSTAGKPILGQIDSAGLSDVLIIVVRYFGGIKLGVPGLINAYRTAAADAISNTRIITKIASGLSSFEFDYDNMPRIMKLVKDMGLEIVERDFAQSCFLKLRIRLSDMDDFFERMKKIGNFNFK